MESTGVSASYLQPAAMQDQYHRQTKYKLTCVALISALALVISWEEWNKTVSKASRYWKLTNFSCSLTQLFKTLLLYDYRIPDQSCSRLLGYSVAGPKEREGKKNGKMASSGPEINFSTKAPIGDEPKKFCSPDHRFWSPKLFFFQNIHLTVKNTVPDLSLLMI